MSREPLSLILVLHAHQPVSNPDSVVNDIISSCYRPVLQKFSQNPDLKFVLHISGSLLDRWQRLAPDLVALVKACVKSGQIELLGGTYHEALLSFIPSVDRQKQFKALARRLKTCFGTTVHGAWLAERVWEPSFPSDLSKGGAEYTLLDDHAFLQTGWAEHQLSGPFLTEDQGFEVGVFPISRALRYLIPFSDHAVLRQTLMERYQRNGGVWVYADDMEKLGAWPGTYSLIHEHGWLEGFFDLLRSNADWLRLETLKKVWDKRQLSGVAYLPATSYPEFLRWSLPPYLRGRPGASGTPRHFLVRYPEVRLLHRRMLMASRAVNQRSQPSKELLDLLWQSQTACAYWHGWFGGAYDPILRQSARMAASQAEFRALNPNAVSVSREDVDGCGKPELILSTGDQWMAIHLTDGSMPAWEIRPSGFDVFGVMHAWEEEGRIEDETLPLRLKPLEGFFLPARFSAIPFRGDTDSRVLPVFQTSVQPVVEHNDFKACVEFAWNLRLKLAEGEIPLRLRKEVKIADNECRFEVTWSLFNDFAGPVETAIGFWIPVSVHPDRPGWLPEPGFPELGVESVNDQVEGEAIGIQELMVEIPGAETLLIRAERPFTMWYQPMNQRLMVEGSEKTILQGLSVIIMTSLQIEAHGNVSFCFEFSRTHGTRDA